MTHDEGYIKFVVNWQQAPALPHEALHEISHWRQQMYQHGLIGAYPGGIGFGNISQRWDTAGQFVISGSATGQYPTFSASHFTLVTDFDLEKNTVTCKGPVVASSESMSHAVIYRECPEVVGIIHVHHLRLWEWLLKNALATEATAAYGTPEMAAAILRLLRQTDLRQQKIFAMEGHREGVFAFGETLDEAAILILAKLMKNQH
ncbi:MAG: class II aldolase/adducin family protein [Saprospiraceae bacterium]|nr:MAG: class II aldolase/adducin family protein [Saprospiraceae bacterium]